MEAARVAVEGRRQEAVHCRAGQVRPIVEEGGSAGRQTIEPIVIERGTGPSCILYYPDGTRWAVRARAGAARSYGISLSSYSGMATRMPSMSGVTVIWQASLVLCNGTNHTAGRRACRGRQTDFDLMLGISPSISCSRQLTGGSCDHPDQGSDADVWQAARRNLVKVLTGDIDVTVGALGALAEQFNGRAPSATGAIDRQIVLPGGDQQTIVQAAAQTAATTRAPARPPTCRRPCTAAYAACPRNH